MGPYWAIGCLVELYRFIAITGVIAAIVLIPFTAGLSLILLPTIFAFIVLAQYLRLQIDMGKYTRGIYQVLNRQFGVPPADAPGNLRDRNLTTDMQRLRERAERRQRDLWDET